MYKLTTSDLILFGRSSRHLVSQLRRSQWNAPEKKAPYMLEVAERAGSMTGQYIRRDTPRHFLTDLQAAGLITVERVPSPPTAPLPDGEGAVALHDPRIGE